MLNSCIWVIAYQLSSLTWMIWGEFLEPEKTTIGPLGWQVWVPYDRGTWVTMIYQAETPEASTSWNKSPTAGASKTGSSPNGVLLFISFQALGNSPSQSTPEWCKAKAMAWRWWRLVPNTWCSMNFSGNNYRVLKKSTPIVSCISSKKPNVESENGPLSWRHHHSRIL